MTEDLKPAVRMARRRFLTLTGAATAVAFGTNLPSTAHGESGPLTGNPFTLGVASGDPLPDAVVIWTRLAPKPYEPLGGAPYKEVGVDWQVATDDRFQHIVRSGRATARPEFTASTEHVPVYPACGAVDGDRDSEHWGLTTGWNDASKGLFPDWLQVTFDQPQSIGRVDLYTLDSKKYPAARYGLKDWDVQAQVDGAWQTVAEVRNNKAGLTQSAFTPVTASAVRILCLASNEGLTYSRIVELEIYPN